MSDKNEEFWKELMGEDFKLDTPAAPPPEQKSPQPPSQSPGGRQSFDEESLGFSIEYVNSEDARRPSDTPRPEGRRVNPSPQPPQQPRQSQQPERQPQQPRPQQAQGYTAPGQSAGTPPGQARSQPTRGYTPPQPQPTQPVKPAQPPYQPPRSAQPSQPQSQPSQQPPQRPIQPAPSQPSAPRPSVRSGRGKKSRDPADNFEVEFDFDEEYPDVDEKAIRRGRTKRTGCLSGILMFLFVICVSVVLACVGWIWATDVLGLDGDDVPVEVTIPKEYFHTEQREEEDDEGVKSTVTVEVADMDKVAETLYQSGLISHKWLFKLFSQFAHGDTKVEPGVFTLNMNFDYRALIHGMSARTGSRKTVDVVVPEGYTITQIVALMKENGVCESDDLLEVLANYDFDYDFLDSSTLGSPKRLEGYLFPDTYQFYVGDDPVNVVKKFLNNFKKKWTEDFEAKAAEMGYTRDQILTVASMIEKEAGVDAERDSIASVIYNRLNDTGGRHGTYGYLQIDATIYYVTADTKEDFSTDLDSPYNTYLYPGLPPGPIANPGLASIRAALSPAETSYYYYALGQSNAHRFFKTYDEFAAFVNSDSYGG